MNYRLLKILKNINSYEVDLLSEETVNYIVDKAEVKEQISELENELIDNGKMFDWIDCIQVIYNSATFIFGAIEAYNTFAKPNISEEELIEKVILELEKRKKLDDVDIESNHIDVIAKQIVNSDIND